MIHVLYTVDLTSYIAVVRTAVSNSYTMYTG